MPYRSCRRRALCRGSLVVKVCLFVAACLMFYAAYRLLIGVLKSKATLAPQHLDPRPCVVTDDGGNDIPCDGNDDRWTDPEQHRPGQHTPHPGVLRSGEEGAQLYLGSFSKIRDASLPSGEVDTSLHGQDTDTRADHSVDQLLRVQLSPHRATQADGQTEAKSNNSALPVVVVEEHHDVIPYWFQAVKQGLLPCRGNVLLHIDAHADVTIPSINASFPLFRPPELSEMVHLMQRNDMFITAAALTGLFSRYIWVIPPWDTRLHELLGSTGYSRFHVLAGVVQQDHDYPQDTSGEDSTRRTGDQGGEEGGEAGGEEGDDQGAPEVCYCVDVQYQDQQGGQLSTQCFVQEKVGGRSPLGVTTKLIFREQCQARVVVVAEMVTEHKAMELMAVRRTTSRRSIPSNPRGKVPLLTDKAGVWLGKEASVVLDIDEDYYGVEAAITPLHDASLDDDVVDILSETVSRIFCARNAQEEATADGLFQELVDDVRADLLSCQQETCPEQTHSALDTFSTRLSHALRNSSLSQLMCRHHRLEVDTLIAFLVRDLFFLSGRQLLAVGRVGICLRQSPRTLGFDPSRGMKVCTGHNRPGRSSVIFHSPDGAEMAERTQQLARLLWSGQFTPRIVTMARSVRDGYTPRGMSQMIEEDVLRTLTTAYPKVTSHSIVYDTQLLGGQEGWTDRL